MSNQEKNWCKKSIISDKFKRGLESNIAMAILEKVVNFIVPKLFRIWVHQ